MNDPSFTLSLTLGALAVVIGPLLGARATRSRSRVAMAAAAFHPLASLCLFATLAIHMHRRLGGWPEVIGVRGFPPELVAHADLALLSFGSMILGCLFVWPLAVLLCVSVRSMRPGLRYLGIYALTSAAAFAAMQLAPGSFLAWWWD